MRIRALAATVVIVGALSLAACSTPAAPDQQGDSSVSMDESDSMATESMDDESMEDESMMSDRTGEFAGLNGKTVAGTVTVSDSEIVLDGFSSDEGPDLHVYLTNGTDEAAVAAGVRIDAVAFDEASQTFMISDIDTSMYTDVVIHCDKASAVFGAAPLG